jgi:uncharacterized membrane protein YkvA (DUF1232 family)
LWFAMHDARTPLVAKAVVVLVVAYALSPIDLIPDFIPVLGYLDELLLLPFAVLLVRKLIPDEVWTQAKDKARARLADGRALPHSRVGALIVIALWIVLAWWLISLVAPRRAV